MGKQGTNTSGIERSPARINREARRKRSAEKRRASRSSEVVTYRKGETRPEIPGPTERQVTRQERWLSK